MEEEELHNPASLWIVCGGQERLWELLPMGTRTAMGTRTGISHRDIHRDRHGDRDIPQGQGHPAGTGTGTGTGTGSLQPLCAPQQPGHCAALSRVPRVPQVPVLLQDTSSALPRARMRFEAPGCSCSHCRARVKPQICSVLHSMFCCVLPISP